MTRVTLVLLFFGQAMPIVVEELREYFRSIGKDIYNRETSTCPTEAEYLRDYYASKVTMWFSISLYF